MYASTYNTVNVGCTYAGGSFTLLCDFIFLFIYHYKRIKLKTKTNFMLKSIVQAVWANFLRVLTNFIIYLGELDTNNISHTFCDTLSFFLTIFRLAEHLLLPILAYAVLYKIITSTIAISYTPGEKYLFIIVWSSAVLVSIFNVSFDPPGANYGCSSKIFDTISQIVFLVVLLVDTIIFSLIVYNIKAHKANTVGGGKVSIMFYILLFVSFDYLRLPYYICYFLQLMLIVNFKSGVALVIWGIVVFINYFTGAVICTLFSYNLGNFGFIKKCFEKSQTKLETQQPTPEERL